MIYNGYAPILGDDVPKELGTPTEPIINRNVIVLEIKEGKYFSYIKCCYHFDSKNYPADYQNTKYMTFSLRAFDRQIKGMEKGDLIAVQFWLHQDKDGNNICQLYNWYSVKKNLIK